MVQAKEAKKPEKEWTFLSNHAHVLVALARNPDMLVRQISEYVGITERTTQAILVDLEEAGYVERNRRGRRNSYKVLRNKQFRHPEESNKSVSQLLDIFVKR